MESLNKMLGLHKSTIVCIRHGESEANVHLHEDTAHKTADQLTELIRSSGGDPALTTKGEAQAKATAEYLQPILSKIVQTDNILLFTSKLKRAQQTALALKQYEGQALYLSKLEVKDEMTEFSRDNYPNVGVFVDQIFELFVLLQQKAEEAMGPEPQGKSRGSPQPAVH
jgi:broad specificity phosphatase PhoE